MNPVAEVRVDKWLWAVRLFKTRSLATQACRGGHVSVNGVKIKPSRNVQVNEVILVRTGEIERTIRVVALLEHRVGPKLVASYYDDLTPASVYLAALQKREAAAGVPQRARGSGRPTKKERRQIDALE